MTRRSRIDQRTAGGLAGHVGLGELGFPADLRDALYSGFALFGTASGEDDDCTGRRETFRHAEADAAIAAGDNGDAARKIENAHWIPLLHEARK